MDRREQELHRDLIALAQRISALGKCDDNDGSCSFESGPYCGGHPNYIDDEVDEARRILAALSKAQGQ